MFDVDRFEATFDVDSRAEARAVRSLLGELYDTVREEFKTVYDHRTGEEEVLEDFRAIRDAGREESPGRLTIVYEREVEEFDE